MFNKNYNNIAYGENTMIKQELMNWINKNANNLACWLIGIAILSIIICARLGVFKMNKQELIYVRMIIGMSIILSASCGIIAGYLTGSFLK